jgi:hypothetical protein
MIANCESESKKKNFFENLKMMDSATTSSSMKPVTLSNLVAEHQARMSVLNEQNGNCLSNF